MIDLIVDLNNKIENRQHSQQINVVNDFPLNIQESCPAFLPKGSNWNLIYHNGYNGFYYHDKELSMWLSVQEYMISGNINEDYNKLFVTPDINQLTYMNLNITSNVKFDTYVESKLIGNNTVEQILYPREEIWTINNCVLEEPLYGSYTITYRLIG